MMIFNHWSVERYGKYRYILERIKINKGPFDNWCTYETYLTTRGTIKKFWSLKTAWEKANKLNNVKN